ncbi:Uncoordinated protein 58 [Toxocara canis]|uniref:Uncoordinated protein 58 n=1 Tax=Toxocara canis TaxID=6265 RepID=A0A0B2V3F1_TOXCA|nr:Uncoordinated protein 58 [Toxocara canis]
MLQLLKILLPHVGLNVLLLTYIAFGALVFIWLEADNELQNRRAKLQNVLKAYGMIMNETYNICAHDFNANNSQTVIERRMRPLLSVLSRAHEYDDRFTLAGQLWTDSEEQMVTRWSFAAAVLYALTVITSTGYDHVTPSTDPGRIFTVFFGLVGIPLMFITAADIGKFLSEIVIRSYGKLLELFAWIGSVVDAIREYINDEDDDSIDSRKRRGPRRMNILDEDEDEDDRLQLPIASYFALIIGYCAIGSLLFNAFEKGPIWSFMHGLFFSFNTITTIGLGNIYVRNQLYLALIVAYVIIGLAVITASLDLCSSTLKRTFTKLHYFGRKIRGARRGFANMSDDIREAMRIIAALKKTRPSKERITLEDLKRFLEVQEHLIRQPYVPYNVHIFRWIEDAYAQYFDEAGVMSEKEKICSSEPILFF